VLLWPRRVELTDVLRIRMGAGGYLGDGEAGAGK